VSIRTRDLILKYAITFLSGGLLFGVHMSLNFDSSASQTEMLKVLCDAFTIPGILLISFSLLLWASSLGAFDGVGYGIKMALMMLIPFNWRKDPEKYETYLERRKNSRAKGFWYMLFVGLFYMALALIMLAEFNKTI